MTTNDLPAEVIRATKVLEEYVNTIKMAAIRIDYLGGIHLIKPDGKTEKYISPIASDFMLMRQVEK